MNDKKSFLNLPIVKLNQLTDDFTEIFFTWPKDINPPLPGEFLTIGNLVNESPLLRRPFAFSGFKEEPSDLGNRASAIIQKRGPGTTNILKKREGDTLNILGPLGNGFPTENITGRPVCIAGGIGIGPIIYLYNFLKETGKNPLLITGFRNSKFIPETLDLDSGNDRILCTDDGSKGFKGNVVSCLESLIPEEISSADLFCCGPYPMLAAVSGFASKNNLKCIVSVEEIMACGVGACMGCSVPAADGKTYLRACKDGPAFDSRELLWN